MEFFLKDKIPNDIELILHRTGFDSKLALLSIDESVIVEIEKHANEDRSVLSETSYENIKHFKFKPGHKIFLLNLSKQEILWSDADEKISDYEKSDFSFMLRKFIQTAESNSGKHPKGRRFDETIRSFSTYIYLMCGRACYETLSANFPIPQATTICKCLFMRFIHFSNIKILNILYNFSGLHR